MSQLNVLALLNQPESQTPETFLEHALSQLIALLPSAQAVAVYQVATNGVVVWQTNGTQHKVGEFLSFNDHPTLQQTIETGEHRIDDSHTVFLPLTHQQAVIAILEVQHDNVPDIDALQNIALDIALGLHTKQVDNLVAQQTQAILKLNNANTLLEVDGIVAATMARSGQFVGMNVFEFDEQGSVIGAKVIASANRHEAYPADTIIDVPTEVLQTIHDTLLNNGNMLISHVASDTDLDTVASNWLMAQKAVGAYLSRLQYDVDNVHSFISLLDSKQAIALTPTQQQFFTNIAQQAAAIIDRQQLVERTLQSATQSGEQAQVLSQINMLINTINAGADASVVFEQMAKILLDVTGTDHVGVVLRQQGKAIVVGEAPDMGYVGRSMELGNQSIHALLEQIREPIIILDVAADENVPRDSRKALMESNIASLAVIPMFDENDNLLGSIGLDYFTVQDDIPRTMIDTAQNIITQVALTLQKLQLLSEAQQRTQQLQKITEFGQTLRANLDIQAILSATLDYMPDLVNADYVGVLIYDRRLDSLRGSATYWAGQGDVNLNASPVSSDTNNIAEQAWETREIVEITDINTWDWQHPYNGDVQSMLAMPLISGDVTLGVLEVASKQINAYKPIDVTTMRQISNQLAIALSNAEAYTQSQQVALKKTRANDIISKLQQQMELQDILTVTVQELGQALGAKNGRIRLGTPPERNSNNGTGA